MLPGGAGNRQKALPGPASAVILSSRRARGGTGEMDSSSEVARELTTLKTETAKQYKELKKEIEELRAAQAEILERLRSEDRQPAPEEKRSASRPRRHERGLETFCPECLGLQSMVEQRSVRMADGSPATAGECSTCGTMLFRMTTMSGTLATEDGPSRP